MDDEPMAPKEPVLAKQ